LKFSIGNFYKDFSILSYFGYNLTKITGNLHKEVGEFLLAS
jgi:hypothetical protein